MAERRDYVEPAVNTPAQVAASGALEGVAPPGGDFDPAGRWTHQYRLAMVKGERQRYRGLIRLEREPLEDGFRLSVRQSVVQDVQAAVQNTVATIECAGDPLATPRSWRRSVEAVELVPRGGLPDLSIQEVGRLEDGRICTASGGREERRRAPARFTANWCLFEAVQRLAASGGEMPGFTLLDELDKPKEGHRLTHRGRTAIPFGDSEVRTDCYQQLGRGQLPMLYYVGPSHRLLLAVSGRRVYVLDPNVPEIHRRTLERLTEKGPWNQ